MIDFSPNQGDENLFSLNNHRNINDFKDLPHQALW